MNAGLIVRRTWVTMQPEWQLVVALLLATALAPYASAAPHEKVIYRFNGQNGAAPFGRLTLDQHGRVYGVVSYDASNCFTRDAFCGAIFELTPEAGLGWKSRVLRRFFNHGSEPYEPLGGLVFDSAGNLYGTTSLGGSSTTCEPLGCGTVFKLTPSASGEWSETVIHTFSNNGTDGYAPNGDLFLDKVGNLYGTTTQGGQSGTVGIGGVVFKLSPQPGGEWTETILHSFGEPGDGFFPLAGVTADASGNLYGTTDNGGTYEFGTVYELSPSGDGAWKETILHSFNLDGVDGVRSDSGLVVDPEGNLYGVTSVGSVGSGTVFELSPVASGQWQETILYDFEANPSRDGNSPRYGLTRDENGNFYGTTVAGGMLTGGACKGEGCGTVYELSRNLGGSWTEQVLHRFVDDEHDGITPESPVSLDRSGYLYGATIYGGGSPDCDGLFIHGCGTVFELRP